jgi:hypothetical protein
MADWFEHLDHEGYVMLPGAATASYVCQPVHTLEGRLPGRMHAQ